MFTVSSTNATTKNTTNVSFTIEIHFLPKSKGAKSSTLDMVVKGGEQRVACDGQEYNVTAGGKSNITRVSLIVVPGNQSCVDKIFKAAGIQVKSITYNKRQDALSMVVATGNATQAVTLDHEDKPSPSPAPSHKSSDTWTNSYQYLCWAMLVLFLILCGLCVAVAYQRKMFCFAESGDSSLSEPMMR